MVAGEPLKDSMKIATTMPPTLAKPVPKPAPIPAKTVPRGLCKASRRRPISSSVARTMISNKAIFCDSATGTFVVRTRPKGSPINVPIESSKTVFFAHYANCLELKARWLQFPATNIKGSIRLVG